MNPDARNQHLVARGSGLIAGLCLLVLSFSAGAEPRIAPVLEDQWTEEQRDVVEGLPSPVTHAVATYLHHPALTRNIIPFENYISGESALEPRHRELLILRTAWLTRSNYVWAHRAEEARSAGITDEELQRVAEGPDAGWDELEAALLRAADELNVDSFISAETWATLEGTLGPRELVDLVFTVGEFTMIAGTVNSLRVEIEPELNDRLPYGTPFIKFASWTNERLIDEHARIAPLEREDWTPEIRRLLDPEDSGRNLANVYKVYVNSYEMDLLRRKVSEHIRNETTLTDRQREVLLLRIGVLCRSEYEWAAHYRIAKGIGMTDADLERIVVGPSHPDNDPIEYALMRATDELYRDDAVSTETWNLLAEAFDTAQLLDVLTAIGGYRMFSMAINSFGVQLDANMLESRFPPGLR